MANSYQAQRQKNIENNRALLLSLGLEQLQSFAPAAVSAPAEPKPKPGVKPKAKPKAKEPTQKRKRDDIGDAMSVDGDAKAKAPRLEGDEGEGRRRSTRRGAKPVTYNEDELFEKKETQEAKRRALDFEEDSTGRTGNRLGVRKHNPYVNI
jgi:hypothetical protein